MDTRALFALCLAGILLVAFGCTGSNANPPASQPPAASKPADTKPAAPGAPAPAASAPASVPPKTETPKETAPASDIKSIGFVNSKCTFSTAQGSSVMLFKDLTHYKTESSKNGKVLVTMWVEGNIAYTLSADQPSGIMVRMPESTVSTAAQSAGSEGGSVMPAGVEYSCVAAVVSDADVTHPAGTTFMDLSAIGQTG